MGAKATKDGSSPQQPKHNVERATVLGGGAFGTAMAQVLARNQIKTTMWVLEPEVADDINKNNKNQVFLPDVPLHKNVTATTDFKASLEGAEIVLIVIPTPFLRQVVVQQHHFLPTDVPLVCCTKGMENETLLTPYEILVEELPGKFQANLAALSGPSFAREVATRVPTSVLVASKNLKTAEKVQLCMSDSWFRVFTGTDIIGAEICGAMKNVIAIACGASHGLGLGHNTLTMLITIGLGEVTRVAIAKGAHPSTMTGLAGLGDLVLTCTSVQSRNYTVGTRLAKGETMEEMAKSMKTVAEGVKTSKSIFRLANELGVHVPLCTAVYKVLWEGRDLQEVMSDFANGPLQREFNPYEHYQEKVVQKSKL
eukprot:maker-scaffold_17-snap-gene-2.3-mRNA-1 protein AED:0.17 eAED:0.17 QI:191/1/1/1/0.5/0.33/3/608/367